MYSVSIFGDGGAVKAGAPVPQAAKPAQGLFGAAESKAALPMPRPEYFGRR